MRFILLISILLFCSCNKSTEPVCNQELALAVESAEVTEVWLLLQSEPIDKDIIYVVKRDTQLVFSGTINTSDTLLHDEDLKPARDYQYMAYRISGGKTLQPIVRVTTTTMDTTSHNFAWDEFEFGDYGSSYFSDVAIINENNIWAVGKIFTDSGDFNAAHWNGDDWELKRIVNNNTVVFPIRGIYVFSNDNIWFAAGSIYHLDGNNVELSYIRDINTNEMVEKLWASSEDEIYGVGQSGIIVFFNGQYWQKLDSGTEININDIWGCYDEKTDNKSILCPAAFKYELGEKKLLNIRTDNTVIEKNWPYPDRRLHSVWFKNYKKIMICGAGVFTRNRLGIWKEYSELPLTFTNRIRGNDTNDIFVAGDFGFIAHYNGMNWNIYKEAAVALFHSLDYKSDIVCAVGERNSKAKILIMHRN